MKTSDAIEAKGTRVTAAKGLPKYTGVLVRTYTIGRTWYGEIACDDGETRAYRVKWLKAFPHKILQC